MKTIYQGTTKSLLKKESQYFFEFNDTYSIFDWGIMPDTIPNKGFNLCQMGGNIFDYLSSKKIKHHMIDYFNNKMQICFFESSDFINLEIIFRFGVPKGSSLIKKGFELNSQFQTPLIEFTTKREAIDRELTHNEAKEIAKLTNQDFNRLILHVTEIATHLRDYFNDLGIKLWDGKLEFAFKDNEFILCDSIGIDELRLSKNDIYFSKEIIREYYKQTPFYEELKNYKKHNQEIKKNEISHQPKKLCPNILRNFKDMYTMMTKTVQKNNPSFINKWLDLQISFKYDQSVLIVGDGAREHTIAKTMKKSHFVKDVYIHTKRKMIFDQKETVFFEHYYEMLNFIISNRITLVIIGPEKPLCEGLADQLRKDGINVLGPSKAASLLEQSKSYTKDFLNSVGINNAKGLKAQNAQMALTLLKDLDWNAYVIKIDTLAQGKGVIVCDSKEDAIKAIHELDYSFPNQSFLIEERLSGKEVSLFYLIDKNQIKYLGDACDYKRLGDNDQGPNTGGMGTYSPSEWSETTRMISIQSELKDKIKQGLSHNKIEYNGILFVGLMINKNDYNVLEFNVRLGDPETQVLLPRIKDDLFILFNQAAQNIMDETPISFEQRSLVHVVCTSQDYPKSSEQKHKILFKDLLDKNLDQQGIEVVMGAIEVLENNFYTNGGRICGLTAQAINKEEARKLVYDNLHRINYHGKYHRGDIAK